MSQRDSVSGENGSMLPLFVGLLAIGLVLSLGAAEICSGYLVRESLQQYADQLSLIAAKEKLQNTNDILAKLRILTNRYSLTDFRSVDGLTAEVKLCTDWQGWLRLPGLAGKQTLCAWSASR